MSLKTTKKDPTNLQVADFFSHKDGRSTVRLGQGNAPGKGEELKGGVRGGRMQVQSSWKMTFAAVSGECSMRQGRGLNICESVICQVQVSFKS